MTIDISWIVWSMMLALLLWTGWQVALLARFYSVKPKRILHLERLICVGVAVLVSVAVMWIGFEFHLRIGGFTIDIPYKQ